MASDRIPHNLQIVTTQSEGVLTTTVPDIYLAIGNLILTKTNDMGRQEYAIFNNYCQTVKNFADRIIDLVQELNDLKTENLESECYKKVNEFNINLKSVFDEIITSGFSLCRDNQAIIAELVELQITFHRTISTYDLDYYISKAICEWLIRKTKVESHLERSISTITKLNSSRRSLIDRVRGLASRFLDSVAPLAITSGETNGSTFQIANEGTPIDDLVDTQVNFV